MHAGKRIGIALCLQIRSLFFIPLYSSIGAHQHLIRPDIMEQDSHLNGPGPLLVSRRPSARRACDEWPIGHSEAAQVRHSSSCQTINARWLSHNNTPVCTSAVTLDLHCWHRPGRSAAASHASRCFAAPASANSAHESADAG
jgi:hypothetical protein